jgi:hypothetical protein
MPLHSPLLDLQLKSLDRRGTMCVNPSGRLYSKKSSSLFSPTTHGPDMTDVQHETVKRRTSSFTNARIDGGLVKPVYRRSLISGRKMLCSL